MFFRKISFLFLLFLFVSNGLYGMDFSKKATAKPVLVQQGSKKAYCPVCGMNLKMFYKTSYTAKLNDGTKRQYCSMRCLVVDMNTHTVDTNSIEVVDAKTQKLIDAKTAYYVVGSKIKGTMSRVSKFAFASKEDAKEFVQHYKGKIVDFNRALDMAKKSLNTDIEMINKKKSKKIYPMGKKIFVKMCKKDIDLKNYNAINELKADIKNNSLCKHLKEKQLQALALYLWEVKRLKNKIKKDDIVISKDEKCPVCGMFVYKYPKWGTQIIYISKSKIQHLSFDGVKDMMKFYFEPEYFLKKSNFEKKNIKKILIRDYYTQEVIDARDAYFVVGSDIYGPMGDELIGFKNKESARRFLIDHRGKKILKFDEILLKDLLNYWNIK